MTKEELNQLAEEIRSNKTPRKMTKRAFVNAWGFEKRTSGNVAIINDWLSRNQLITSPNYKEGGIDEEMELRFKYLIRHKHFQLYSLWIDNYRNLNNFNIDFENTKQYCTLIGLNGSGKSNVIEAISEIFRHLYKGNACLFKYVLRYIMDGEFYEIRDGKINGEPVSLIQLPRNIVASYSGEDNRMWKTHFWPLYQEYCQDIASMPNIAVPQMLAVGRKQWNIAFLTLLFAQKNNTTVEAFLKSIIQTANCQIHLKFNEDNLKVWKETTGKHFVNALKSKNVYSVEEFSSVINGLEYVDSPSTLFNLLYQATSERGNNPISDVDIVIDGHGSLNGLSEGEKKMIVVITIMEILSTERSLCLFDEPDSHVHVSRKMEMLNLIDTNNRYSVLTTHSPMFIDEEKECNIRYMNNGKVENVDKVSWIRKLSDERISYNDAFYIMGAKRKILLTEGPYDKRYLEKAIDVMAKTDSRYSKLISEVFIVKCGGTGSAILTYEDLVKQHIADIEKVVFLFDYDAAGVIAYNKVSQYITDDNTLEKKLVPLFYQEDYSVLLNTTNSPTKGVSDYMVEDIFPKESYQDEIDRLLQYGTHKEYRKHDDNVAKAIKTYLEKHYSKDNFKNEWYNGFKPILEKLMEVFDLR